MSLTAATTCKYRLLHSVKVCFPKKCLHDVEIWCSQSKRSSQSNTEVSHQMFSWRRSGYFPLTLPADERYLNHAIAIVMKKSPNSQTVSIVLPRIRPSAPPMSHIRDNSVYPSCSSMYVDFISVKYIYVQLQTPNTPLVSLTYSSVIFSSL